MEFFVGQLVSKFTRMLRDIQESLDTLRDHLLGMPDRNTLQGVSDQVRELKAVVGALKAVNKYHESVLVKMTEEIITAATHPPPPPSR